MSKVFSDVEECVEKGILIGREGEKKLRSEAEVDDAISEGADKFLHGVLLKRIVAVKFFPVFHIGLVVKYRNEDGKYNVDSKGFSAFSKAVPEEKKKHLSEVPRGEYLVIFTDGDFYTVNPKIASKGADNFTSLRAKSLTGERVNVFDCKYLEKENQPFCRNMVNREMDEWVRQREMFVGKKVAKKTDNGRRGEVMSFKYEKNGETEWYEVKYEGCLEFEKVLYNDIHDKFTVV
uniref:Uncharacterized protein n=1 Tax=Minutocellus polymorphus TaxID=265543 RepID=A0A7S0FIV8_9STRA|mmetsp:Transcript_13590/g.22629  ORF Transcript_13590/g.22629 Transcript_13590/m.22629 type:complete len:234 (+) Transcript_13590:67-768(+)